MSALKCCFNWRVAAGLGVLAAGTALLYPGLLARLGPLLIYAVCPLSMLAMMWTMGRMQNDARAVPRPADSTEEPMVTIPASLFARLSTLANHGGHAPLAVSPRLPSAALMPANDAVTSAPINEEAPEAHAPAPTIDRT